MKFKTLNIKNFGPFRDVTLDLADRGLVLILGENRDAAKADSNGSGKSFLFDALCWCLWGQVIRGIKGDSVVNRLEKKNCVVEVTFSEDNIEYRVVRRQKDKNHFKANDLEFFVNGVSDCGVSIADTQQRVITALGLDFTTFKAMMPGAGIKAAEMTDKSIKELLEGLLQTELFADAQKIAKERLKALNLEISYCSSELARYTSEFQATQDLVTLYGTQAESFDGTTKEALRIIDESIAKWQDNISQLNSDISSVGDLDSKENLLREEITLLEEVIKVPERVEAEAKARYDEAIKPINYEAFSIKAQIQAISTQIEKLKKLGVVCVTCDQPISYSVEEKESELRQLLSALKVQAAEILGNLSQLAKDREIDKALNNQNRDKAISNLTGVKQNLELVLRAKSKKSQDVKYLASAEEELKRAEASRAERETMVNPFFTLLTEAQAKLEAIAAEQESIEKTVAERKAKAEELEFWIEAFSPRGMRSHMLRHITPILNDRANHYCQLLTDGEMKIEFETEKLLKNGSIKDEFNILVDLKGSAESYAACSGGEKARADLVIALVLGDLASFRANKKIPFRFMDEAFERVDSAGLSSVVNLLNNQKEKYETIFVITHSSELKEYFSNTITVVKEGYRSHLEDQ